MPKPIDTFDDKPISRLQYATIFVCFLMNILDGTDVLVISYCAPAIAQAWGTGPEALGIVFSAGLAGMMIGSIFLAPFADQIGRKSMIISCALIMAGGMYLTAYCETIYQLGLLRFISGIGIGGMLASTAALTAEYTPDKTKDFWVSFVIAGYPTGAVLSGFVAAEVVPNNGWEQMFRIAGLGSLITLPLIWLFLSESIEFYLKKQPANALSKINAILTRMDQPTLSALPAPTEKRSAIPIRQLLSSEYRLPTFQLWGALFLAFATLYFLTSWIPKLAANTGMSMSLAIYAGTVFNAGAILGVISQGYFSSRSGLKKTICVYMILNAVLLVTFSFFIGSDLLLLIVFGLIGFTLQGGFVGLYAVAARMYPTTFRTMGVGWAIGAGRLGGVIGPAVGGLLVGIGLSMAVNFIIFAVPIFLAGIVTLFLSSDKIS
jgi:benzoate transport